MTETADVTTAANTGWTSTAATAPTSAELATQPLRVYRLAGTQREMGAQFGALSAADGGYHAALDLYANRPTMAAVMVAASMPHALRPTVERVADALFTVQRRRLQKRRDVQFREYSERTRETFRALGVSESKVDATFVMESLQNIVGLASRTGLFDAPLKAPRGTQRLLAAAPSACSSLAAWGEATVDGSLRHARNFDFPGGSIWDRGPTVVFCSPDDGLRYGYVSTRGLDAPGITCFNEAGLTLTVHTRFHREVGYSGPSVIDLGHELIRTCRTLDEVAVAARHLGATSTWGLLVSSAEQRSAIVVEMTAKRVEVIEPEAAATHLSCTNRYMSPALREGQVASSPDFGIDSDDRQCQLEAFAAENHGAIDTESMQWLLGDLGGVDIVDLSDDVTRISGSSVVAHHSVASIVSVPDRAVIDVSVGPTPTGFGPYASVPWSWDGPVGAVDDHVELSAPRGRTHRGRPVNVTERDAAQRVAEIVHRFLEKASPEVTRQALLGVVEQLPTEPTLRRVVGQLSLVVGQPDAALEHLDVAVALEGTPGLRAKALLARSRAKELSGDAVGAQQDRNAVLAEPEDRSPVEHAAARRESVEPMTSKAAKNMAIDILHLDIR